MEEKKVREAIDELKTLAFIAKKTLALIPDYAKEYNNEIVALETGIKALEKQLPRKGIKKKITNGTNKGLHEFYCPVCTGNGDWSNKCNVGEYCSDCGQKLDWSVKNE